MAEYTENFNLKKPGQDDFYNVKDFNDNADIIDQALKAHDDALATKETPQGAQEKAEAALNSAKQYTDQEVGEVAQEFAAHKADNFHHIPYVIATGTNSYAVNIQGITALTEGMSVKVKFTNANTGASTLNINGLGAKPIRKSNGNALSSGNIKAGQICHLVYTGSVFQLLGEGGEYGTAQAQDVLEGKTIGTEEGLVTGTMPNRGAINRTITTQGGQIVVPEGYHNGSGVVRATFANLTSSNIKKGVNIGGIRGTYEGEISSYVETGSIIIPKGQYDIHAISMSINVPFQPMIAIFSYQRSRGSSLYAQSVVLNGEHPKNNAYFKLNSGAEILSVGSNYTSYIYVDYPSSGKIFDDDNTVNVKLCTMNENNTGFSVPYIFSILG